ncbi:AraC family transcriptional regulator [Pseudomonas sp. TYF_14]|uniref:AraC family transcriptional regulator n=1 Tax=Pseudomonas sp. TYF_14 TaxID=3367193 RepID=UPI00370C8CCB
MSQWDINNTDVNADLHDMASAQNWMSQICGPHQLSVRDPQLRFRHLACRLESLTMGMIEYGTDATITIVKDRSLGCFSISLPFFGEQELKQRDGLILSNVDTGVIVSPDDDQELTIGGDCRKMQLIIPKQAMLAVLQELIRAPIHEPLRFNPAIDAVNGNTGAWWRLVKHTFHEMQEHSSLYSQAGMSGCFSSVLIRSLLLNQPNNFSREIENKFGKKYPNYLVKAKDFIETNARLEIRLQDIENAAGVTRYKLFESFGKYLDMSPMAYLKQYRLLGARREIMEDKSHRNVADIALAWGFNHLGRFAADYKSLFGESPRSTVSRNSKRG